MFFLKGIPDNWKQLNKPHHAVEGKKTICAFVEAVVQEYSKRII